MGLAVGDAVGTTVEFSPRETFATLTDMVGGGPFNLRPGEWTDDTSMALCLAVSLIDCRGFDATDQMTRYCRWRDQGYMSSTGFCFDIGETVNNALDQFQKTREPFSGSTDLQSAGNGSIMRLAPIVLYYYPDAQAISYYARKSSRTTHGALECVDACQLLSEYLRRCLDGRERRDVLWDVDETFESSRINAIAKGAWRDKTEDQIRGSGYVVECLEAALWCFANTGSFREAVLRAANLGDDADTTAAVCGQIAGAYYGIAAIPARWIDCVVMKKEMIAYADSLEMRIQQET